MKHPFSASKALTGLASIVLFATALPVFAGDTPGYVNESGVFDTGKMSANAEADARTDDTCAAADRKEPCKTVSGFPPMDMAASLFSAMSGCSRSGR